MKKFDDIHTDDQPGCPKRLWVMLTLSDDELVADEESLPNGLRFHLSRCSSCRALAGRLMAVSSGLRDLAQLEPEEEVVIAANGQLRQALHEGARLTGRVEVAEEPVLPSIGTARHNQQMNRTGPGWYGGAVAAAAVVVAVSLWGVWGAFPPEEPKADGVDEVGQAVRRIALIPLLKTKESPSVLLGDGEGFTLQPSTVGKEPVGAGVGPTNEPVPRVADARPEYRPKSHRRSPRFCADDGYGEAAGGENAFCVHRAITLPRRGRSPRQHATRP